MRVNVVCRNWEEDRVLPRFARYLARGLGWTVTPRPVAADVHYLMGYFECQMFPAWPARGPAAALFTHREETDASKAALFDRVAGEVDLRVVMCRFYSDRLTVRGPTVQPPLPVERDRFVISERPRRARPVVGVSGYTYRTGRKGDDLVAGLVHSKVGERVDWKASGRGWPVPVHRYSWAEMPRFYQEIDVLLCPSRVEGGPMTVLEALACGTPIVVPRGVGILDELPVMPGIHRYPRGDAGAIEAALEAAAFPEAPVNREALRAATAPFTVEAWCERHVTAFGLVFG